jgi:hypothetical protein
MSPRPVLVLALTLASASSFVLTVGGCGADATDVEATPGADAASASDSSRTTDGGSAANDGGTDANAPGADAEAGAEAGSCPQGQTRPATGETCVGYGKGSPCNAACGEYGYVCFKNGGPPGFAGCSLINDNGSFGQTYCCTENKCVAQPDEDAKCTTAGKTHRYQCPPDGAGGSVAPPAGCADGGAGGSALERFYCCP